jgi:hypothetical protein
MMRSETIVPPVLTRRSLCLSLPDQRKTCAISRKPGKLVKVAEITGISSSDLAALLISPPNFCAFAAALNKGRAAELAVSERSLVVLNQESRGRRKYDQKPTWRLLELCPVRLETKACAQLDSVSVDVHLETKEFRRKMRKPIFAEHTDVSSDHESRARPDLDPATEV